MHETNEVYFCSQCIRECLPYGDSPDTQDAIPLTTDIADSCTLCVECNTDCVECDVCENEHRICNTCNDCLYHDYESLCEIVLVNPMVV